jgi:predicted Zn-ribbon and HTH transcriptional regulator
MVFEAIDKAANKITSIFGSGTESAESDGLHQYQCFDCGMDFKSRKGKEHARCPDCGGVPAPDTVTDTAE